MKASRGFIIYMVLSQLTRPEGLTMLDDWPAWYFRTMLHLNGHMLLQYHSFGLLSFAMFGTCNQVHAKGDSCSGSDFGVAANQRKPYFFGRRARHQSAR